MKKLLLILSIAVFAIGCDDNEPTIFDGEFNDQALISFGTSTSSVEVLIDADGTTNVPVFASNLSDQDRVVPITLVDSLSMSFDQSNLASSMFSATIPAGLYEGSVAINVNDVSVETDPTTFVLSLPNENTPDLAYSSGNLAVSVFQVCPLDMNLFVGDYLLVQDTPINPDDGVQMFDNQIVTLRLSDDEDAPAVQRVFDAVYLEGLGIGQPPSAIVFNLLCEDAIIPSAIGSGLGCGDGAITFDDPGSSLRGQFDINDDSVFTLTLNEYSPNDGGCGANPYPTTFTLTKQ